MFSIESNSFETGTKMPKKFTQEGQNLSPLIEFEDVPDRTAEIALICDDPDAPMDEPFVHWVAYGLDANTTALPEGVPAEEEVWWPSRVYQGKNTGGEFGYTGPLPPKGDGEHHYRFHAYALSERLNIGPGAGKDDLLKAMRGKILAEAELVGLYERQS